MRRESKPVVAPDGSLRVLTRWIPSPVCSEHHRPLIGDSGRCQSCFWPLPLVVVDEAAFAPSYFPMRMRMAIVNIPTAIREAEMWRQCFRQHCLPVGVHVPHIFTFIQEKRRRVSTMILAYWISEDPPSGYFEFHYHPSISYFCEPNLEND